MRLPGTVLRSSGEWPCTSALGLFTRRVFGRQREALAALERDREGPAVLGEAQFGRPACRLTTSILSKPPYIILNGLPNSLEPGRSAGNNGLRTRRDRAARPADRSVSAGDHLSARLGDGPLRFPLRLLHVGEHDVPAEAGPADARGTRPAVRRVRRARRAQAAAHRRRAAGAARHHDPGALALAPPRRRARRADRSPPTARSCRNTPPNSPTAASSASTSRSTRSTPTSSARSRAGASSTR